MEVLFVAVSMEKIKHIEHCFSKLSVQGEVVKTTSITDFTLKDSDSELR